MSLRTSVFKFLLGVEKLTCAFDGQELKFPFEKIKMYPQYNYFTWGWLKQFYTGDTEVLRFHNRECFLKFASAGRLQELQA